MSVKSFLGIDGEPLAEVVTLSTPLTEFTTCDCGSVWFALESGEMGEPGAIALSTDGSMAARSGVLVCIDCGSPNPRGE